MFVFQRTDSYELGDGRDATLVTRVKQWLDECTRNLDLVTPVAFTDEPDFWDNLPLLIETIMRRG